MQGLVFLGEQHRCVSKLILLHHVRLWLQHYPTTEYVRLYKFDFYATGPSMFALSYSFLQPDFEICIQYMGLQ